jgi:catechol 2,3-dioxygenase-like lactoylglutathione lyase family enzyme
MDLLEVRLKAADPAALRDFYAATLGLPASVDPAGNLAVQAGATRIVFEPGPDPEPVYHFAFNIPTNRFPEAKRWLQARTALLPRSGTGEDELYFDVWNAHACYFADPAGNILELIARHNLHEESEQPFGSESILRVSEIGLPAPTVAQMVDALTAGPDLCLYSGDRENFAALGDEHGLVIVVPEGRGWLPEERVPAAAFPAVLTLKGGSDAGCVWDGAQEGLPYRLYVKRFIVS